jgi:hypothetical protein
MRLCSSLMARKRSIMVSSRRACNIHTKGSRQCGYST